MLVEHFLTLYSSLKLLVGLRQKQSMGSSHPTVDLSHADTCAGFLHTAVLC